jgi:hypothetical protein
MNLRFSTAPEFATPEKVWVPVRLRQQRGVDLGVFEVQVLDFTTPHHADGLAGALSAQIRRS